MPGLALACMAFFGLGRLWTRSNAFDVFPRLSVLVKKGATRSRPSRFRELAGVAAPSTVEGTAPGGPRARRARAVFLGQAKVSSSDATTVNAAHTFVTHQAHVPP